MWSFYFQVCRSSSFSSLAFPVVTPVTSFPGWPWAADWQGVVCIRTTLESGSKTAPDKQVGGNFPSRNMKYLQIPFLIISSPMTHKCPPVDSNFPSPLFQLLFLPLPSTSPPPFPFCTFSLSSLSQGFLQYSPQHLLHQTFHSASFFPPPTLPHLFWRNLWA